MQRLLKDKQDAAVIQIPDDAKLQVSADHIDSTVNADQRTEHYQGNVLVKFGDRVNITTIKADAIQVQR